MIRMVKASKFPVHCNTCKLRKAWEQPPAISVSNFFFFPCQWEVTQSEDDCPQEMRKLRQNRPWVRCCSVSWLAQGPRGSWYIELGWNPLPVFICWCIWQLRLVFFFFIWIMVIFPEKNMFQLMFHLQKQVPSKYVVSLSLICCQICVYLLSLKITFTHFSQ